MKEISAPSGNLKLDAVPDCCPICHHHIEPRLLTDNRKLENISNIADKVLLSSDQIQLIYRCPRDKCQSAFIADYRAVYVRTTSNRPRLEHYSFIRLSPRTPETVTFPEEVEKLSPDFVDIYTQANTAENQGLKQVAGCGYRKALEFLVKDYAKEFHPDDDKKIEKMNLGNVIDQYLDDPNLNSCAKGATWLGNDETHYVRKWEDKDINDLKTLIKLTYSWIETNLLTEKFKSDMGLDERS